MVILAAEQYGVFFILFMGAIMKTIKFTGIMLFLGVSTNAWAACPIASDIDATRVANLTALLSGNTVCVGTRPNWDGQEYHEAGTNKLIDYKHGPKVPKTGQTGIGAWNDWTQEVGNWRVVNDGDANTAVVTYDYDRNGSYEYSNAVYQKAGKYYFCNATQQTDIESIKAGQVPCGQ